MFSTMHKIAWALILAACLSGAAIGLGALAAAAEPATSPTDLSLVDRRVDEWSLTKEERRFDEIGWAKDLPEAERLAGERKRPLFVFTYSGSATEANAIALRRC